MRRKKTVKPTRFRATGVVTFFVLAGIAGLAVLAAQWRQGVQGVDLQVKGLHIVTEAQIRKAAGVSDTSALAELDLLTIRRAVLDNPFVKDADVQRAPPRTLRIDVLERTPIAMLLNVQAKDWLIDEDGFVLPAVHSAAVHDLPVLTGSADVQDLKPGVRIRNPRVQKALQVLKTAAAIDPAMMNMFSEVNLDQRRDLVFYTMEGGVPVIFGSTRNKEDKLRSFAAFWENVAMKYDPTSLEYVDLRWKKQVVTRWRDASSAPEQAQVEYAALPDTNHVQE
ncbi:cell division protein FtsQ/DivIB [bacterium]|nr:cell division protein FtsQ/DivIB [bacterium]